MPVKTKEPAPQREIDKLFEVFKEIKDWGYFNSIPEILLPDMAQQYFPSVSYADMNEADRSNAYFKYTELIRFLKLCNKIDITILEKEVENV